MLDEKSMKSASRRAATRVATPAPLYAVCSMPHEAMEGATLTEKTAYWEARMNEAAKGVNL